jgi:hypothetical protein
MPERPGPWELLDQPSDPVVADLPEVNARLAYFRSLAQTMTTEGQRLSRIASGESLKGQYADKLRADSVAKDLDQVVGRYDAVVQALTEYEPALDAALVGSSQALDDAINANSALLAANAMPTATAPLGKQLTPQQEQANADKAAAIAAAADRLNAARQKLAGVLSALDEAGQAAAAVIRKGFNDGLTDSAWDRFKYFFKKFLQILVKVLTYIGMALAVIALVIPGVGEAVLAASLAIGAVAEGPGRGLLGRHRHGDRWPAHLRRRQGHRSRYLGRREVHLQRGPQRRRRNGRRRRCRRRRERGEVRRSDQQRGRQGTRHCQPEFQEGRVSLLGDLHRRGPGK